MENETEPDGLDVIRDQLASETERANHFEARLKDHILVSTIGYAARSAGAFNEAQILASLRERASVVPAVDKEGKPTGEFDVVLTGGAGEQLTPRQAVEALKATDPNFFLSPDELLDAPQGDLTVADAAKQGAEAYRAARHKLGLRPRRNNR